MNKSSACVCGRGGLPFAGACDKASAVILVKKYEFFVASKEGPLLAGDQLVEIPCAREACPRHDA